MAHTLEEFLFIMEDFPHMLAEPEYGFQVEEIKEFAKLLREFIPYIRNGSGNIIRTDMTGKPYPDDWNPPVYRYMGTCNGCLGPIWEHVPDPKPDSEMTPLEKARRIPGAMVYEKPDGSYVVSFPGDPGDNPQHQSVMLTVKEGIQFLQERGCPNSIIFEKRPNGGFVMS